MQNPDDIRLDDRASDHVWVVCEVFPMRDRCDVRHHVQRRELLLNADDARFDRPWVGEVELNPVHARMRGRDRLEQRLPTTRDDHVIAAEVELLGEGTPDAARAAGDEDRVVAKPHASTASCQPWFPIPTAPVGCGWTAEGLRPCSPARG